MLEPNLAVVDAKPKDWESRSALEYDEGALHAVGRAYKRECGWDMVPGPPSPDYVWVCVSKPIWGAYDEDAHERVFSGTLVGFCIVADRDEDGEPESLAHLWVARQERRGGHATLLLAEAERRFPALRTVEDPTADGVAFPVASGSRLGAGLTLE